jgi:hypothetical protein
MEEPAVDSRLVAWLRRHGVDPALVPATAEAWPHPRRPHAAWLQMYATTEDGSLAGWSRPRWQLGAFAPLEHGRPAWTVRLVPLPPWLIERKGAA